MAEDQNARDGNQQYGDNAIEPLLLHADRPSRAEPRAEQATAEKIDDDRPVAREVRKGDSGSSKRQSRRHNHETRSLVENDCFESCKAKQPNQQRQAKLSAATAQGANDRTAHEGCDRLTRAAVDSLRQGSAPDCRIMASVLREVPHAGLR